ncbi:MAG: type I DNA topoisomerase [Ilumatobacteraceae bacterium]
MSKPLVIVESPAKAKTISQFLGSEFIVRASVGHIADLPSKGLAVDVDNDFKAAYELTERGRQVIRDLKADLKGASVVYLATDEDREGEAISAHLREYLNPKVDVHRMVFHEITKSAIAEAVANPRTIDTKLVDAAEARRILDRLYGYEVSPVLWRRVNRGLSAGRVQSPALRLIVERERERIAFRSAAYFDIDAKTTTTPSFSARLTALDGTRVATGKDFDQQGNPAANVVVVTEVRANELVTALTGKSLSVISVEDKPYRSSPKAPFMTSTLQQEAGRKLRLSGRQVMSLAQSLYENGFITYMRTDSVVLAAEAMGEVRDTIRKVYGNDMLSPQPRVFNSKVKNAQEAHEAIRPTLPLRAPEQVEGQLKSKQEVALYRLIWQRTLASQMADATGVTVSVKLQATAGQTDCEFSASGTTITKKGYRQAYEDLPDDDTDDAEATADSVLLPPLTKGDTVLVSEWVNNPHATTPPARYTEASLVKRLEEEGIGRPSTWASIISTMVDRGDYVRKKGTALVPTWTAFSVIRLLENHFTTLIDYKFTASVEEDLDAIARGEREKNDWLHQFYFGTPGQLEKEPGLKKIVADNLDEIDAAEINTFPLGKHPDSGDDVVVKPGKYGPYVRCGENTAGVPDTLTPEDLTLDVALQLLAAPKGDEPIGQKDGLPVFAKSGRYGAYVQWGTPENPPPGMDKPKMVSLFATMNIDRFTMKDAEDLLSLPRTLGNDPADGEPITAQNGRFGPYISKGKDSRTISSEEHLLNITLEEALALLAQPRTFGRGRAAPKPPLKEFGNDPVSGKPVVAKEGRFGDYVTDGETNAGLKRGDILADMTPERAFELLQLRREYVAENGGAPKKRGARAATPKKAPAKKAAAKKAPAKKAVAKKTVAKQASAKTKADKTDD